MPRLRAMLGLLFGTGWPSTLRIPESAASAPVMILTSVDLPAPFSPTSACTSPAWIAKSTPFSACTPANAFVMDVASSKRSPGRRNILPSSGFRGAENGICHILGCQGVPERRLRALTFAERDQEIRELMNEGVLVADLQSRHPPALHIGMIAIRHMNASPAAQARFIAMIEELDAMQIMQVPHGGSVLTIDFECIQRLMASRVTRRFQRRERSVLKPPETRAGVIDLDRFNAPGQVMLALLDERFRHRRHLRKRTVQPQRRIDAVRQQVAGDAAARDR